MKKKFYMAAVATALCTALIAPVFTTPVTVYAGGTSWYWEEETPLATALWGKYSPDGKLVYRISCLERFDFYTEDVDEILNYGFEITDERVNERGETYYKFEYAGTQKILPAPQTGDTEIIENTETYEPIPDIPEPEEPKNEEIEIPPVEPDEPTHTETEEPVVVIETPSDYEIVTIYETEYPTFVTENSVYEEWIPAEIVEVVEITEIVETSVEIVEVTEIVETPVEIVEVTEIVETPVEIIETTETFEDIVISDYIENEQVAMAKKILLDAPICGTDIDILDCGCRRGHCFDGKEIIWEKELTVDEEPTQTTITVPGINKEIPWHEELLHNPANSVGSTAGKEDIWEFMGEPSVDFLGCKAGACYQVRLTEDFTFRTENVDWICECGFRITGETINKHGLVIYSFEYVG